MINIVSETIDIAEVIASVGDPSAGAIDIFVGTTRNHSSGKEVLSLEYQAYEPMASKMMEELGEEARRRWHVKAVSIVHRIGRSTSEKQAW